MISKYKVAILGGTGFVGAELYRLLTNHPFFEIIYVSSESKSGTLIEKSHRAFRHTKSNPKLKYGKIEDLPSCDIVFSALPTGVLPSHITELLNKCKTVFNISGDFRFKDPNILSEYYSNTLAAPLEIEQSCYFIPELHTINRNARIINLPGCMAVASIYNIFPLIKNNLIESDIFIDAKTASSGAGKSSSETHAERNSNFRLYRAKNHRHLPEIKKVANSFSNEYEVTFCTYSLDLSRGIMSSSYSKLKENISALDVQKAYHKAYANTKFLKYNKSDKPMIKTVVGTNYAEVTSIVDGNKCISICTIDNLLKGAAGQAIQAANIYFGIDETTGLLNSSGGLWP